MNIKIVGTLVMTLLITTTVLSVVGTTNEVKQEIVENKIEANIKVLPTIGQLTWIDKDWDYSGKMLYPWADKMIILFGIKPWVTTIDTTTPRIQANAAGGARILATQGNTADKPAIGFFSINGVDDGAGGNGIFRPLANEMAFSTMSTERMRITAGGAVGIGTTDPNSKLHVCGSVAWCTKTVNAYPDYNTASANAPTVEDHVIFVIGSGWYVLPSTATCPGREYVIKNIGTGVVQLDCYGLELIEGASCPYNPQPLNPHDSVTVVSNGLSGGNGEWWIIADFKC